MPDPPLGYGRQSISAEDVAAVARVVEGQRLTQGPAVGAFEAGLMDATGAPHAVAVANGSLALLLAHRALGIGPGARVLTSANTFLASATSAVHLGAEVAFLDVVPETGNLDLDALEAELVRGARVDAVVAVHFAGLPLDMERLLALKAAHGFRLIEDAAHALGGLYRVGDRAWRVGEHAGVDATVLSFHPVKHVTTAEGGAVLTHDPELAARVRRLANHGVDPGVDADPSNPTPMVEPGYNARLSDVHAALGVSQLGRLDAFLARRRALAARYHALLPEILPEARLCAQGGGATSADPEPRHAWHLLWIHVERRDALRAHLAERGIGTQIHYYPVPEQPWFAARGAPPAPNAREHARKTLSLPIYPDMTERDHERVLDACMEWRA